MAQQVRECAGVWRALGSVRSCERELGRLRARGSRGVRTARPHGRGRASLRSQPGGVLFVSQGEEAILSARDVAEFDLIVSAHLSPAIDPDCRNSRGRRDSRAHDALAPRFQRQTSTRARETSE